MIPEEVNLDDAGLSISCWDKLDGPARLAVKRSIAQTYEQWMTILYTEIDKIVVDIQDSAQHRKAENSTEDSLTNAIVLPLNRAGFDVGHETNTRGHPDIRVTSQKGYKWLGEAKIYSGGYFNIWKGFLQLTTRYSNGNANETHGGLIIYIYHSNAEKIMNEWRDRLSKTPKNKTRKRLGHIGDGLDLSECWLRKGLAFFSKHNHNVSGLPYSVRHFPVLLHYDPKA